MVGAIRRLEVLSHPLVTIECFGWVVFFRAVFTWQDRTFLSLLNTAKVFQRTTMPVPEFIGRCVALEQRAMWIYRSLAVRYSRVGDVRDFFNQLADQEEVHAELLELCRVAASRGRWRQQNLDAWQRSAADTEGLLAEAERTLDRHDSLADTLRLVIRMESSQIKRPVHERSERHGCSIRKGLQRVLQRGPRSPRISPRADPNAGAEPGGRVRPASGPFLAGRVLFFVLR